MKWWWRGGGRRGTLATARLGAPLLRPSRTCTRCGGGSRAHLLLTPATAASSRRAGRLWGASTAHCRPPAASIPGAWVPAQGRAGVGGWEAGAVQERWARGRSARGRVGRRDPAQPPRAIGWVGEGGQGGVGRRAGAHTESTWWPSVQGAPAAATQAPPPPTPAWVGRYLGNAHWANQARWRAPSPTPSPAASTARLCERASAAAGAPAAAAAGVAAAAAPELTSGGWRQRRERERGRREAAAAMPPAQSWTYRETCWWVGRRVGGCCEWARGWVV